MGFQSQSKVLYKSTDVSFDLIVHLVTKRFEISKGRGECGGRSQPKVTIDANLIGYRFISRPCGPVGALRILSRPLSENYIDVVIIADVPNRHHSKRATSLCFHDQISDKLSSASSYFDSVQSMMREISPHNMKPFKH
eukprot:scaffold49881_cov35-Attheya_sp.AAC.1